MTRRCESCGCFVPNDRALTVRYFYDIDHSLPVVVYSLATATQRQERLVCTDCAMPCCRETELQRGYGIAVGLSLLNGWERCSPETTQLDYAPARSGLA